MQIHNSQKNKIKAWGLVEIMISIGIFGVAIISITSLNARSFNKIKDNELTDQSNRIMISAAEYFKSPAQDVQDLLRTVPEVSTPSVPAYFKLPSTVNNPFVIDASNIESSNWRWEKVTSLPLPTTLGNCTAGSIYQIVFKSAATADSASLTSGFLLCSQVVVEKRTYGYQITSNISYRVGGIDKTNQIKAYRPFTYAD